MFGEFEGRMKSIIQRATNDNRIVLFLDEVQNFPNWAPQLKSLVDHHTVHVVATGSSALRIEAGRDSLAGRITPIELGTLLLREIVGLRFRGDVQPHSRPSRSVAAIRRCMLIPIFPGRKWLTNSTKT